MHVPQISDHDLIFCHVNLKLEKTGPIFRTSRDFKNLDYNSFKSDLISIPWNNIYDIANIDQKVNFLNDNINILLNIHAPFKTYKITKNYASWRTDTIIRMTTTRNRALTKFKKTKNGNDWQVYKSLRNAVTAAVRKEKKVYYSRFFNNNTNQKNIWAGMKTMGLLKQKNNNIPYDISNVENINNYFINSVPNLQPDKELISFYSRENILFPLTFQFTSVTEIDVLEIIKNIKTKAVGNDGINICTIHLCVPHILPLLRM